MLEEINYLIHKLDLIAKREKINIEIKIYDVDYEQCTTLKYDIAQ